MTTSNKKLIEELKKYNSELDGHVSSSGIDINLMTRTLKNNSSADQNEEFIHLFSQNLLDLRTEVSLLRKNLSTDIEGMVMKVVSNQQNQFSEKMNNLFLQTTLDMKTFLNDTVIKFGDEITQIKKTYNEMVIQNSNISSEMLKLKDVVSGLQKEIHAQDITATQIDTNRKLDEIENVLQLNSHLLNDNKHQISDVHSNVTDSFSKLFDISHRHLTISTDSAITNRLVDIQNLLNLNTKSVSQVSNRILEISNAKPTQINIDTDNLKQSQISTNKKLDDIEHMLEQNTNLLNKNKFDLSTVSNSVSQVSNKIFEISSKNSSKLDLETQNLKKSQISTNSKLEEIEQMLEQNANILNKNNSSIKNVSKSVSKLNNVNTQTNPDNIKNAKIPKIPKAPSNLKNSSKSNKTQKTGSVEVIMPESDTLYNSNSPIPNKILDIDSRLNKLKNLR